MHSALMLRRFYCSYGPSSSSSLNPTTKKKQLVFMGSPQVSTSVLDALLNASATPDSMFQVAAIVTQPPSGRDRGRKVMPSPVAQYALDRGFPSDLIFTPEKAGEEAFLSNLRALQPELCITAAYGNILPSKFLKIPPLGTVNIHPSLLPLYRGAAPVQRALQDGVKETGVSLVYTVRALDAGPVIACERFEVEDHVKAQELLEILFNHGSKLLIRELHSIFDGSARQKAEAQDDSKATHAPKEPGPKRLMKTPTSTKICNISPNSHGTDCTASRKSFCLPSLLDQLTPEESWLSFDQEAHVLHNKVRAFAGWPGTRAKVRVIDTNNDQHSILELKIITTRACSFKHTIGENKDDDDVTFNAGALMFPCGGQSTLEVLELQLPGKKVVNATAFWNGLRGRKLKTL